MTDKEYFLTPERPDRLRAELEQLRGPRRTALAQRLRHAVQQGDLSENADYINAKEEQAFLEGRIQELETILREAKIVEGSSAGEVSVGNTVVVARDGDSPQTYHVVGIKEASPREGRISNESPIGKALMGKKVGEVAVAETPAGRVELKILEIR